MIWIWHTPKLYVLALDNLWWHAFEHACFLFTGWLFWWSALRANPKQVPQALMAVLLTLMHTGLLGALLGARHSGAGSALDLLPEWWHASPCVSADEGSDA